MNDKQNAKQNMHKTVSLVLSEYSGVYSAVPAMNDAVDKLNGLITEIDEAAKKQSKNEVKGTSKEKNAAETHLVTESIKVAGALFVLAEDDKNQTLQLRATVTKSMMYHPADNETLNIAKRIFSDAQTHAERLSYYGINSADIDTLGAAIAAYEPLIAKPRAVTAGITQVTANLVHLFAQADTLLNDRIDKLMSQFKTSAPEFYAVYFNARNIINTSARKRKDDPGEDNDEGKREK